MLGVCFPLAERLAEETEKFYKEQFQRKEFDKKPLKNVRYLGKLQLNADDEREGLIFPRLEFKKEADRTNPAFYIITTNDDDILYAGTSVPGASEDWIPCISVSATTGGAFPPTESKGAYALYLALLSAVRFYHGCRVYEVLTGFENMDIRDQFGDSVTGLMRRTVAREMLKHISYSNLYVINNCLCPFVNNNQHRRDTDIWNFVSAYKLMLKHDNIQRMKTSVNEKEEKQKVIIKHEGSELSFTFAQKMKKRVHKKFYILDKLDEGTTPKNDIKMKATLFDAARMMLNDNFWKEVSLAKTLNELRPEKLNEYMAATNPDKLIPGLENHDTDDKTDLKNESEPQKLTLTIEDSMPIGNVMSMIHKVFDLLELNKENTEIVFDF